MSHPNRYLRNITPGELITMGESITGTGAVESAVNAFCFVGAYSDGNCRMCIPPNAEVYIGYDSIVYKYFGPSEVCIGSGGAGGRYPHYVTTAADWVPTGTTSHTALDGRSDIDSHPQSAITSLVSDQAAQDTQIATHIHDEADGTQQISHNLLLDRYTLNQHRIANITDLQDTLDTINTELARLEQVKLDIADALAVFSFAAYANLRAPDNAAFPNLGVAWQKINILTDTVGIVTPRGITVDRANSSFTFDYDGVYRLSLTGSIEHNSSNSGRITHIRIYNETTASGLDALALGTGRNAEATSISASLLTEIGDAQKGQVFSFQIGNGDTYSAVSFQTIGVAINAISEWREPLGGAGT